MSIRRWGQVVLVPGTLVDTENEFRLQRPSTFRIELRIITTESSANFYCLLGSLIIAASDDKSRSAVVSLE